MKRLRSGFYLFHSFFSPSLALSAKHELAKQWISSSACARMSLWLLSPSPLARSTFGYAGYRIFGHLVNWAIKFSSMQSNACIGLWIRQMCGSRLLLCVSLSHAPNSRAALEINKLMTGARFDSPVFFSSSSVCATIGRFSPAARDWATLWSLASIVAAESDTPLSLDDALNRK